MLMDKILILDFGSQYTQLIARRVRELNVYCEIFPFDISPSKIQDFKPKAIIFSGGPNSVIYEDTPEAPKICFALGCPILGICYGMQTLAKQLGGAVENSAKREFGHAEIRAQGHSSLLIDLQDKTNDQGHGLLDVWMSHGDKVTALPDGFSIIASNASTPIAAIGNQEKKYYGVQFHPEVTHTKQGKSILKKFVIDIAETQPSWNMPDYVETAIAELEITAGIR